MEKVTKINLTPENFHSEMFYMPNKIGMTNSGNSFRLLVEAFRRKHFLKSSPDFLGLGRPSDYKSDLFKPSFGLIQKGLNWFKLSEKGEEKMKQLEEILEIKPEDFSEINLMIFKWQ